MVGGGGEGVSSRFPAIYSGSNIKCGGKEEESVFLFFLGGGGNDGALSVFQALAGEPSSRRTGKSARLTRWLPSGCPTPPHPPDVLLTPDLSQ